MDYLSDFLKEASHQVSHHFQEDFLISREEMLRIKDQLQKVLKSDCIKLQGELRRVGEPRDKVFPHSVQVQQCQRLYVRHVSKQYHRSVQSRAVDVIRMLMECAIQRWSPENDFISRCVFVVRFM